MAIEDTFECIVHMYLLSAVRIIKRSMLANSGCCEGERNTHKKDLSLVLDLASEGVSLGLWALYKSCVHDSSADAIIELYTL